ncbi:thiamine-phosphate kinase [Oceanobacillus halophilus]|uniref:Thiamine-monophosphate kinase n=1 Tax=Oceanobacillus halophilus TaxID=930130 RepID=A0A494ZRI1_9BACI|nr:thiamine-phosphate kinase [Oceanobacillus halophilus]RKQ28322.1 thiamine-phosphate kinase [Oceanobacillus halophilus]
MDEFSFIQSIKQQTYHQTSLVKGIGDDAAVFRFSNEDIVTAVDTFVDGIHFSKATMDPYYIGYRALAANLSDLAAMGANPAFYLVSIVIPENWLMEEITAIFNGMKELATTYNTDIIGGDTVSGKELCLSITVIGYTKKGMARYRSDARPGDIMFVTGNVGDSQAGFHILTEEAEASYRNSDYFIKRHIMPSPRVEFAQGLSGISRVALNDISDGIASEANEIAEASHVTIYIDDSMVPVSSTYEQFPYELQHKWKYYGGEDFELIGTVSEDNWEEIMQIATNLNLKVTKIGYVDTDKRAGVYLNRNNKIEKILKKGYNHLR